MTDKPLNVQVAEALGWSLTDDLAGWWTGIPSGPRHENPRLEIPPYGEDSPEGWACTGPLLKQFEIGVIPGDGWPGWRAGEYTELEFEGGNVSPSGEAETPCEAIARCIIALKTKP